jgi:hypothetical protein
VSATINSVVFMSNTVSADRRPVSRGCCLSGVLGLVVLALAPCLLFVFVSTGELHWQRGEFVEDRLWLVQETDAAGLGYSSARIISRETNGPVCVRTNVIFVLWQGASENLSYCECYAPNASGHYDYAGSCSP